MPDEKNKEKIWGPKQRGVRNGEKNLGASYLELLQKKTVLLGVFGKGEIKQGRKCQKGKQKGLRDSRKALGDLERIVGVWSVLGRGGQSLGESKEQNHEGSVEG